MLLLAVSVPVPSREGALPRLLVPAALGGIGVRYGTSKHAQEATDRIAALSGGRRLQWVR
jgi:hypothetical protein